MRRVAGALKLVLALAATAAATPVLCSSLTVVKDSIGAPGVDFSLVLSGSTLFDDHGFIFDPEAGDNVQLDGEVPGLSVEPAAVRFASPRVVLDGDIHLDPLDSVNLAASDGLDSAEHHFKNMFQPDVRKTSTVLALASGLLILGGLLRRRG